ncbi:MarR family winged helix-turn-helix transcriptional regulator [Plantactinospora sp. WMMB334]|uniref:MarR family winged helix-turn-helix transcriptional regulator n=1 Tax=Plantactinospora sp. WMMB334 TaxID=3404119 RepID=UPI003B9637BB
MNTTDGGRRQPPIGYALRKLDRLIEERFERTIGKRGVTRRQWQLLNALVDGGYSSAALNDTLAPFLDRAAGESVQQHIDPLMQQGLVHHDGDAFTLTDAGRGLLRSLATDVQALRELTAAGLDERQYEQTVANLQTMIHNLEGAR